MSNNIKHILTIRLSAMGDVAMTVPVLRALTRQYPELQITVLTRSRFKPFFRDLKNVNILVADLKGTHKGILGLFRLSRAIKRLEIDAVADLHNVLRTKILKLFLTGIPFIQLDKGRSQKKALIQGRIFEPLKSMHERYKDVFQPLGYPIDLDNPAFPDPVELSKKLLLLTGEQNKTWIGIAPFAAYPGKMYPLDGMEEVIKTLSVSNQVFLFGGGKEEVRYLDGLVAKHDNVVNLAGKVNMDEELDIMSRLDLLLSMDSGNAHMAAMLGVKVLTIWGVTHPFTGFSAFNQPEHYALLSDRNQYPLIPTSVYGNKCPDHYMDASKTISVQEILTKIESIIKKPYSEE